MGKLPPGLRIRILERDGYRCIYCGSTPQQAYLHVDHVVPQSHGGSNDPTNLVTACGDCNMGKSDRVLALPPGYAPTALTGKPYGRRVRSRFARVTPKEGEWLKIARGLWPDAMDMVEPASGVGRWATVTWCAGLLVLCHREQEVATKVFERLAFDACGHDCWHDHELVDLTHPQAHAPISETRRLHRRLWHFERCVICQSVFNNEASAAAIKRHVARGAVLSWLN